MATEAEAKPAADAPTPAAKTVEPTASTAKAADAAKDAEKKTADIAKAATVKADKKKKTEPKKVESKAEKDQAPVKSAVPDRDDNLLYDMRHMVACDITPVPTDEAGFLAHTRDGVQFLVNQLFGLPRSRIQEGQVVKLPDLSTTFMLPREKPIPKEKPKSRWEKFMEKRGMVKRKKSRIVYDEITEDWKPRWGHRSAAKEVEKRKFGIYEFKKGEDTYSDPFERMKAQKKLDEMKHKMREVRNKVEAAGGSMKAAVPSLGPARNNKGAVSSGRGVDGLREVLRRAQDASSSRMKFDKIAKNEPTNIKKRKMSVHEPMSGDKERERYMKFAGKVLSGQQFDKEKMAKLGKAQQRGGKKEAPKGIKGTPGKGRRSKNPGRTGGKHGRKITKK